MLAAEEGSASSVPAVQLAAQLRVSSWYNKCPQGEVVYPEAPEICMFAVCLVFAAALLHLLD